MSWPWFKNMFLAPVGAQMTDEQMKDIPYPYAELIVHVTAKTVQAGCLLGGLVVAPVYRVVSRHPDKLAKARRARNIGVGGALIGAALGPLATYMRMEQAKVDDVGLYDRCYRLRHNQGQLNTDRITAVTGLAGFAAAGLHGGVMGVNAGLLARGGWLLYEKFAADAPKADPLHHEPPKLKVQEVKPADVEAAGQRALKETAASLADEGPMARADVLDNRAGVSPWLAKWKGPVYEVEQSATAAGSSADAPSTAKKYSKAARRPSDEVQKREAAAVLLLFAATAGAMWSLASGTGAK